MNKRYLFLFAVSSFILTIVWLATNAYHSQATTTIEPLLKTQIEPIDPEFDQEAISELRKRTAVAPLNSSPVVIEDENPEVSESDVSQQEDLDISPTPSPIEQEITEEVLLPEEDILEP